MPGKTLLLPFGIAVELSPVERDELANRRRLEAAQPQCSHVDAVTDEDAREPHPSDPTVFQCRICQQLGRYEDP